MRHKLAFEPTLTLGLVAALASFAWASLPTPAAAQPSPADSDAPEASLAAPEEPEQAAPAESEPEEPHARIDYSDGSFYLRSHNDNLVFVPSGRMHVDSYSFAGDGVSDYQRGNGTGLKSNVFFRRFVIEFGGIVRGKWFYWVGGNFAPTRVDGEQHSMSTANVYDGFIGYMPSPRLKLYFGQYNAPITMENVTSSRWLDMMERALSVRTLASPYNKADGLMAWGDTAKGHFEYQAGVFGGDGQNVPNIDNRFDGMARVVVRPLANRSDDFARFHVGASARVGSRDEKFVQYNAPSMSTPGGYAYWESRYDVAGDTIHIRPSGLQTAFAAEAYVPFERFDLRGEMVYVNENRSEVSALDETTALRMGKLSGVGAYFQASVWVLGSPRINGNPAGLYGVTKLPTNLGRQAEYALQLVLRGEVVRLQYDASSRSGADPGGTSQIDVNAVQLGLNYWATKHIRLTAEYSLYHFPGNASSNQAVAPGVRAGTAPSANALHEISFRVGLAL